MNTQKYLLAALIATPLLAGGCANSEPRDYSRNDTRDNGYSSAPSRSDYAEYGVVEQIDVVKTGHRGVGAGAVIGGVVGGLLGNQVGAGSGKTAATVAGVVGGALVGNEVQKRRSADEVYRVDVRIKHGGHRTIEQKDIGDLRVGDRVAIRDGAVYRD
jgi:Predicted outer membrane lipoprotein